MSENEHDDIGGRDVRLGLGVMLGLLALVFIVTIVS